MTYDVGVRARRDPFRERCITLLRRYFMCRLLLSHHTFKADFAAYIRGATLAKN